MDHPSYSKDPKPDVPQAERDTIHASGGPVKVWRCPHCNAWDYALQGENVTPGTYQCDHCGGEFWIPPEPKR